MPLYTKKFIAYKKIFQHELKKITFSWRTFSIASGVFITALTIINAPYFVARISYTITPPAITIDTIYKADTLSIPTLGIEAPLIYTTETTESAFQKALRGGVVHYPNTANVGEIGNAYFFGHSSDALWSEGNYKAIFAQLPKIKIGDEIIVTNHDATPFTYSVTEVKVVRPNNLAVTDQNTNGRRILTLQTSYPIGTALKRFLVIAELQTTEDQAAPTTTPTP